MKNAVYSVEIEDVSDVCVKQAQLSLLDINWSRRWSQSSFVVGVYVDADVSGLLLPEIRWIPKFLLCGH